ncbi:hypothetical protein [Clostridium felsineum]|uniref:Uncharacterized protein n=1 Tax=Clostridium felsineum TaxID=36839 RepID=A0A1S8L4Q3_9CLOT|nr:hypothetical protein [Clostridium felsineum]URZ06763.1 hypothetical protein CLROS_020960 [Clostridium felsineum]URZ11795.1 hypothetical protein CROST_025120 [Clostridium felsineum]
MDKMIGDKAVTQKADVTNVVDSTVNALDILKQMASRKFDIGTEHYELGLYAEENKDICPDLIETMNLGDGDIFYLYDTTKLLYYTVDAIKRLNNKITDLENQIASIKTS